MREKDISGMRFGMFQVIDLAYLKNGRSYWNVVCDCGNEKVVRSDSLKKMKSCGCEKSKNMTLKMTKHGETKTRLYQNWRGMKGRCYGKKTNKNRCYQENSITICNLWANNFDLFKEHVSGLEHFGEVGYTLDRIDNNKGYEPGNVRWATTKEQANNRRDNRLVTYNGKTQTLKMWSDEMNVNYSTLSNRMKMGWSDEDIISRPVEKKGA